jgi:hypothetical protein
MDVQLTTDNNVRFLNDGSAAIRRCADDTMEDVDLHDMLGVLAETLDPGRCSPASDMSAAASHFDQLSEVALSVSSASDMTAFDQAQDIDALPMLNFELSDEPLGCEERFTQAWEKHWKPVSTTSGTPDDSDFTTMIQQQAERIRMLESELVRSRSEVAALQRMLEKHLKGEVITTPDIRNPAIGAFSPVTPAFVSSIENGKPSYVGNSGQMIPQETASAVNKFMVSMPRANEQVTRADPAGSIAVSNGFVFTDNLTANAYDRRLLPDVVDAVVSRSSSARNLAVMENDATGAMLGRSNTLNTNLSMDRVGIECESEGQGQQCKYAPFHDGTFLFPSRQAAEACAAAREVFGPAAEALEKLNYRQQMAAAARHRSRRPQPRVPGSDASLGMETDGTSISVYADGSDLSFAAKRRSKRSDRRARPLGTTRYWADIEHELFLLGCKRFGPKNFAAIAGIVKSRSPKQVRTHLQKYQLKLLREARRMEKVDGGAALAQLRNVCDMAFTKAQLRALGADESQASQQSLRLIQNREKLCQSKRKLTKRADSLDEQHEGDDSSMLSPSSSSLSLSSSSSTTSPSESVPANTDEIASACRHHADANESPTLSQSGDPAAGSV